jgi:GT2 family glycosyltransferase
VEWLGSGNLAVRRRAFDDRRGFDETLETCEDVDLCQRLGAAGWRVVADERLRSVHHGDPKTLRELFRSERWRGRDNLRVSFRRRPTVRDLPSIVIPIVDAAAMAVFSVAVLLTPFRGITAGLVALAALSLFLALAIARALRMAVAGRLRRAGEIRDALAVAVTYDAARASALLVPAGHRRARPAPAAAPSGS